MGKKSIPKQDLEKEVDPELQAEIAALMAMREEKKTVKSPIPGGEVKEKSTYNKQGLLHSLETIETANLPFIETLQICDFELDVQDQHDDLDREMSFYNHTLLAVKRGYQKLEMLNIPIRRPLDFFCEHLKSDSHMIKIKDRLIMEEKKMEAFEQRKLRETNKKFNKQVQLLKKEEKSQQTKTNINNITNLRKNQTGQKRDREDTINKLVDGNDENDHRNKSVKRIKMDKKYGFGGKDKSKEKRNDKKSINDMSSFNARGGKFVRRNSTGSTSSSGGFGKGGGKGRGGGGGGGGGFSGGSTGGSFSGKSKKSGKPNRPGKEARTKKRASKSS